MSLNHYDIKMREIFYGILDVENSKTPEKLYLLFRLALIFSVGVFIVNLFSIGTSDFGQWGDFFGGVLNPILTFLMFMGVLITLALQQRELSDARIQFERSASALEAQQATAATQAFESTLFNIINSFNQNTSQLDLIPKGGRPPITGRDCFETFYTRFSKIFKEKSDKHASSYSDEQILYWSFDLFYKENEQNLSNYFQTLDIIFRIVRNAPSSNKEYLDIVLAQLSNREIIIYFYYLIADKSPEIRSYLEEQDAFSSLPVAYLLNDQHAGMGAKLGVQQATGRRSSVRIPPGIR